MKWDTRQEPRMGCRTFEPSDESKRKITLSLLSEQWPYSWHRPSSFHPSWSDSSSVLVLKFLSVNISLPKYQPFSVRTLIPSFDESFRQLVSTSVQWVLAPRSTAADEALARRSLISFPIPWKALNTLDTYLDIALWRLGISHEMARVVQSTVLDDKFSTSIVTLWPQVLQIYLSRNSLSMVSRQSRT